MTARRKVSTAGMVSIASTSSSASRVRSHKERQTIWGGRHRGRGRAHALAALHENLEDALRGQSLGFWEKSLGSSATLLVGNIFQYVGGGGWKRGGGLSGPNRGVNKS